MIILQFTKTKPDNAHMVSAAPGNIRVLIVTPTLECGGAERFVSLLCNNLHSDSLQVSLAVINNKFPFYKISNPGIPVTDLGVLRVSRSFNKLRKLIEKEKPDIVFTTANHLNLFAVLLRFLLPKTILWVARETSVASITSDKGCSRGQPRCARDNGRT